MRTTHQERRRHGQIIVLAPIMVAVMGTVAALTADVGQMFVERARLQNAADAASLAAAYVLVEQRLTGQSEHDARQCALTEGLAIAQANRAQAAATVQFGSWQDDGTFAPTDEGTPATAVHVRTVRDANAPGGPVLLSFARLIGMDSCNIAADATCEATGFIRGILGGLRPFAIYEGNIVPLGQLMTFYEHEQVEPGNFGLLDLNGGANGTPDLAEWIKYGYDGEVTVDDDGYIWISGDPGFRSALKDDIATIWGEEIYIVVYDQVTGSGSNASFRCIGFLGIVITDSQLTGNDKYITCVVTGFRSVHDVITGGEWISPNLRKVQLVD